VRRLKSSLFGDLKPRSNKPYQGVPPSQHRASQSVFNERAGRLRIKEAGNRVVLIGQFSNRR
jgi:hypothetical protein